MGSGCRVRGWKRGGGGGGSVKVKCLDNLIEDGLLKLESFRRGQSDNAKHHVAVNDVDRHAVPLGAVQNSRKGAAGCRLAIALKGILGNPVIILVGLAKLSFHLVAGQLGSAAPHLAVDD